PADAGKLYKWVDENGKVHYTDTPPPESSKQERQVLNDQGLVTETLDRQKTPEEIAAEEAAAEEARKQKELEEQQKAEDRALLSTYTNVEQIEMARDGRIAAIDSQINVVSRTISTLEERLAGFERQAAALESNDKPVPERLKQQIQETRDELLNNQRYLMRKEAEQQATREKFDEDIRRFRELSGGDGLL
ncbi:MAG: DUF4124 domain-containing protein, partial [Gammaproteobacteria bacterium]|nr:DUF4124 domain-containing protein [Gammaproteobacteria bacterium]